MRILPLATVLALAACAVQETPSPQPIASAAKASSLSPASNPAEHRELSPPPSNASSKELGPPPKALQPPKVDTSRKLDIVDVYVDTRNPASMRQLVPYLMRTDEWVPLKVVWTSTTTRHYRFQRVASTGESLPTPDPLIRKRGT